MYEIDFDGFIAGMLCQKRYFFVFCSKLGFIEKLGTQKSDFYLGWFKIFIEMDTVWDFLFRIVVQGLRVNHYIWVDKISSWPNISPLPLNPRHHKSNNPQKENSHPVYFRFHSKFICCYFWIAILWEIYKISAMTTVMGT